MSKPTRSTVLLTVLLLTALVGILYLRANTPPSAARLLPECDAIVYANLKPLRAATHFDRTAVSRSPDFQQFIDATGIVPERDLDSVAFALHHMGNSNGPNGPVAYSEVFQGRFDAARLTRYLSGIASSRETYAGRTIFSVPVGDPQSPRSLRITQISPDTLAASNMPTPEQIHAMLDRHRSALAPFSGPTLLGGLYDEVPALSSGWAIGHIGLPFAESGFISFFGLRLPLSEDTTFIASVRYLGSVHLRVEEITPTPSDAAQTAQALSSAVSLLNNLERGQLNSNPLRQTLDTIRIASNNARVIGTANIPLDLLRQLATPAASSASH